MPKLKNRFPKMSRDRNQAFSKHNGKRYYHGKWGTHEAEQSYRRFIAALSEGPVLPPQVGKDGGDSLISEIATAFLAHIESRNMDKTDLGHFKTAIGYLVEIYGELSGNEFSPKKLKAVRSQMVKAGTLCRNTVNKYTK
jgi:hypothetical protein